MPSSAAISAFLLLPAAISAVTFDCKKVRAGGQDFNFEKLGGLKDVHFLEHEPPNIKNTTFTIDVCAPIPKDKNIDNAEQCPSGTRVCGIARDYSKTNPNGFVQAVIPIAGEYTISEGRHLEPKFTRLKESESNADSEKEGVRAELHGGMYQKQKQKAIVEFLCDHDLEGTEGFGKDDKKMSKRADEGDDDQEDDDTPLPDLDKGKALQFKSYKVEKDDTKVLRLEWKTKYACEDQAGKPSEGSSKGGWGFFTWFLIIVFLLVAAYIIFGSWLNYNRYGARGWDLIPHGDTIRDIPYIVKDWTSGVADRMKGSGGSRGGYAAV